MDSCVSYLRFPVSHSMAPLSRLLVYYVRDNGEGVTDSLQIPIQPDFENQVCIALKHTASIYIGKILQGLVPCVPLPLPQEGLLKRKRQEKVSIKTYTEYIQNTDVSRSSFENNCGSFSAITSNNFLNCVASTLQLVDSFVVFLLTEKTDCPNEVWCSSCHGAIRVDPKARLRQE